MIPERGNEYPFAEFAPQTGLRTFFKLLFAAASMIFRPVIVDPVNATLSTSMWDDNAAPPTPPREGTVFTTPGGNLIYLLIIVTKSLTFRYVPCFLDEL